MGYNTMYMVHLSLICNIIMFFWIITYLAYEQPQRLYFLKRYACLYTQFFVSQWIIFQEVAYVKCDFKNSYAQLCHAMFGVIKNASSLCTVLKEGRGQILVEFSSSFMRIFCVTMALFFKMQISWSSFKTALIWIKEKNERLKNQEYTNSNKGKYLSKSC